MTDLPRKKPAEPASNITEFTVSEISGKLKRVVEDTFGRVRVRGEIAGYRGPHSSGHMYFALKDEKARLEAVVWRGVAGRLKHRPEEGMEVIATGKLTTYPGSSKYQIVIDQLEPAGAGALMALLEERKKKLAAEGLFAPERKQLLPHLPGVVGVVTSPTGAVIRDILHRLTDRFPLHVIIWPVRVQGETCGAEVANAIKGFNALPAGGSIARPDVLIVARGGGSIEDLWGFNDEALVRAAAKSHVPLISAVGHETDWTLIDLAADVRAPTPTGAAEMAVPVKADLEAQLASVGARLKTAISRLVEVTRTNLRAAARGLPSPDSLFGVHAQRLDKNSSALTTGVFAAVQRKTLVFTGSAARLSANLLAVRLEGQARRLDRNATDLSAELSTAVQRKILAFSGSAARLSHNLLAVRLEGQARRLKYAAQTARTNQIARMERYRSRYGQAVRLLSSYSYEHTLKRGFSVVRDEANAVVTRAATTKPGNSYEIQFADGRIAVIRQGEGKSHPKLSSTRRNVAAQPDQRSLFGNDES